MVGEEAPVILFLQRQASFTSKGGSRHGQSEEVLIFLFFLISLFSSIVVLQDIWDCMRAELFLTASISPACFLSSFLLV